MSAIKEHWHNAICEMQREALELEGPDKRYLAFGFDTYYPNGGLCDMQKSFDTIEEAIAYLKSISYDSKDLYDRLAGKSIELSLYGIEE